MKKSIVLLLSILVFAGCAGQKRTVQNETKMEYKAYSRGFYQEIIIEKQLVFVAKSRGEKPVIFKIPIADWNNLNSAIQELDLDSLSQLKAPTEKRLFDGAAIANLKITKQGKTFESQSFDHGYPPVEIEKVVNKMLSFVK
jgi:PBP1b-binding outer membrane lipoprotein LpoB